MNLPSKHLEEAVEQLSSLPGIGKKTALRLILNILNRTEEEVEKFSYSFLSMKQNVQNCKICKNVTDFEICSICSNPKRDSSIICIVEDIRDILAIEATQSYNGLYHVLGGIISPMDGIGPKDLNIDSLLSRIDSTDPEEVIFALSATMEGDTTNFYLFKKLSNNNIKITTLSRGVSIGAELQYADELTLGRSLLQRQLFNG